MTLAAIGWFALAGGPAVAGVLVESFRVLLSDEIESAYVRKLRRELPDGSCRAWVIEDGERVIASGAVSFVSYVPPPLDPSCTVAYLHSMYTEEEHRNSHCAARIVRQTLDSCRTKGGAGGSS